MSQKRQRPDDFIVFLGPSLRRAEVELDVPFTLLPPAACGDVWKALERKPKVIALIDGVFEASPSVWHKEILSALEEQVAVFGGASMGALRAVELSSFGMVGVGKIYEWFHSGALCDDSEVALLHADAEHDFRPLTVPLVNVRFALEQAVKEKRLRRADSERMVNLAEKVFYQDRSWPRLEETWATHVSAKVMEAWKRFRQGGLPDLKALDAKACLAAASGFLKSGARMAHSMTTKESSSVRWQRHRATGRALQAQEAEPHGAENALKGLLLARWAASMGLEGVAEPLVSEGLPEARQAQELALFQLVIQNASHMVSDGPFPGEGLMWETWLRQRKG